MVRFYGNVKSSVIVRFCSVALLSFSAIVVVCPLLDHFEGLWVHALIHFRTN